MKPSWRRMAERVAIGLYKDVPMFVMDVQMPGMDGLAILQEVPSLSPDQKVIIWTGDANPSTKWLDANGVAGWSSRHERGGFAETV